MEERRGGWKRGGGEVEEGDEDKRRGCRREIGTMNESSKTKENENEEEDIEEKENKK